MTCIISLFLPSGGRGIAKPRFVRSKKLCCLTTLPGKETFDERHQIYQGNKGKTTVETVMFIFFFNQRCSKKIYLRYMKAMLPLVVTIERTVFSCSVSTFFKLPLNAFAYTGTEWLCTAKYELAPTFTGTLWSFHFFWVVWTWDGCQKAIPD